MIIYHKIASLRAEYIKLTTLTPNYLFIGPSYVEALKNNQIIHLESALLKTTDLLMKDIYNQLLKEAKKESELSKNTCIDGSRIMGMTIHTLISDEIFVAHIPEIEEKNNE